MVDSVANYFLEAIGELIGDETKYLDHESEELKQAKTDLKKVDDMMVKADAEKRDSPALRVCLARLRELAFEAESVLETYVVEAESKEQRWRRSLKEKLHPWYDNCIMWKRSNAHKVRKRTKAVMSGLAILTRTLESEFEQPVGEQIQFSEQTGAHEVEEHVVGREKDIEFLVSMVKDESRSPKVIKICGMGGLGKTVLARKVYYHEQLESYARAWVCISQEFQPKATLGRILALLDYKAVKAQIHGMAVADLVGCIYRFLEHAGRCLVVLDDIWENHHWEIMKPAFPNNCNVVLTTRSMRIAYGECHPYELNVLTEEKSWELFRKKAFPRDFAPDESLEDIGRKITVKCGGLPLAISVVGEILRMKEPEIAAWEEVFMNMDSYVALDLSYNDLPYYLKPCLLYLACFAGDENIEIERLYLLWMAEGLLSQQHKGPNETLRDVAQRYVSELAGKSMVQLKEGETYSSHHKLHSCRLHDLIYSLCTSKFEKEKLLKRLNVSQYLSSTDRLTIPSIGESIISRLAINNDGNADALVIDGLEETKGLRSFVLLGEGGYSAKRVCFDDSTLNFERSPYLRILVLDNCDFAGGELPRKVGKLIHLRYLSLKFSNLGVLPQFVCRMLYLQTLDLRVLGFVRLPNLIWKMKGLKHLFLPCLVEVIGGEKLRLDGLVELETLHNMESMTARAADIPKLTSLVTLSVAVNDMDSMKAVAHHMSREESRLCETRLKIDACNLNNAFEDVLMCPSLFTLRVLRCYINGGLPYYRQGMCKNLVKLELFDCMIGGDVMEELGKYPKLRTLELEGGKNFKSLICRSNSFPQLKSLTLSQIPNLVRWEVETGALPKLAELHINNCCNLESVPNCLSLVSVTISGMPKEFKAATVEDQDNGSVSPKPRMLY